MELVLLADHQEAVPVVARWYYDEWGHQVPGSSYATTCDGLRGKLNRDRPPVPIIAVNGRTPIGAAQLKIREMDIFPDREHWLGGVYVAPEARGHGLASKLAARIADIARSFGIDTLYLQTERPDGGLYARLGWRPIERVHHHGMDVLVMARALRD